MNKKRLAIIISVLSIGMLAVLLINNLCLPASESPIVPMVGPGNRPRAEGIVLEIGDRNLSVIVEISSEYKNSFASNVLELDCSSPMLFSTVNDLEEGDKVSFTYSDGDEQENPLIISSIKQCS